MSRPAWHLLALLFAFATVGAPTGHAQEFGTPAPDIQRDRLSLRAGDWQAQAKTTTGVRVGDAVRLRAGADTGRVTSAPLTLPFGVNGIGPQWDATVPEGAAVEVALRVRLPNGTWGPWSPITHEASLPDTLGTTRTKNDQGTYSGGLLLTEPDTRVVQVRLSLRSGKTAVPLLHRLSLYLVNTTEGPPAPSARPRARTAEPDTAKPRIYTRDAWGAQSPAAGYDYAPATHLAIHHTATASTGAADTWEECAAGVRAIQDYHMNGRGWIDIGYNYLICQTGAIFQGREDENDRRDVAAAHDGYNDGSVGTAGLGYFHPPEDQRPTDALLDGFVDLFAWIATRRQIDPDGTAYYAGYGQSLRTVYGHRDVKATACPGNHLYPERSRIVDRLDALVPTPPPVTALSKNRPNPASAVTRFDLALERRTSVRLAVYDLLGRRVASRRYGPFPAGTHTVSLSLTRWPPGTYPYRLEAGADTQTGTIQVVR